MPRPARSDKPLPTLFDELISAADEITEALGAQARGAVELLIQSFSESASEARRRGLPDPLPTRTHDAYEAAVTVMMRVVFLLFAEERALLSSGKLFEQGYGISRELAWLTARGIDEGEEALDSTSLTWHRLLATSRALFGGASFENMRMPAYGGSLFDPARFPFLTALDEQGTLAVQVSDRTMLHMLRSVQLAVLRGGEVRQISFRDIDVEQIGYIYEGLLGYTCETVDETHLGLIGTSGVGLDIPLSKLEELAAGNTDPKMFATAIRAWVEKVQPSAKMPSVTSLTKAITAAVDPSVVGSLMQVVRGDDGLCERIRPFLGLVRTDPRKRPFIVLPGGLLVKKTSSRKNAGAYYTPKSLAEEVVLHALQPLCYSPGPHQTADESEWKLKSSDELLNLKVADIACGTGTFLVAVARYLAERVVEAWTSENRANAQRSDMRTRAIRQVIARCLYGADINETAVEMCKLSLWLVSLDRNLPFSFMDDKIFVGNSLLGVTDLDQLRHLHINPSGASGQLMLDIYEVDMDGTVQRAIELRRRLLTGIDEEDPARGSAVRRRLLADFRAVVSQLLTIADGVVAAGLVRGGTPGKALDDAYDKLRTAVRAAYPNNGEPDTTPLTALIESGLQPTVATDYERWRPLHWVIEAPDVILDNGGFDAIVGNPPFLGGQKLTGTLGTNVRDWLINTIAGGRRGSADIAAYFFLRAASLLRATGGLGLLATNTIAQASTREVGLDAMVAGGFTITRAIRSRSWPLSSANLEYAAVWGTRSEVGPDVPRIVDDIKVRGISTLLEPVGRAEGGPVRLSENSGLSFTGCTVLGMGFVVDVAEAQEWIAADPRNAEVLFPYLNGKDLNSRPDSSASRWVIDFNDRTEAEAAEFAVPFERVKSSVKPERQLTKSDGTFVLRWPLPQRWWQYGSNRPKLRKAVSEFSEVLAISIVSKPVMPMRVPTNQVFSSALAVFATDNYGVQAVLSSSLHHFWAITYGSTLQLHVRYTPYDVFETFPRPTPIKRLDEIGHALDEERREIMLRRGLGLTKIYNLVNDSDVIGDRDISRLREIQVELDAATTEAFGWDDLRLDHGFHTYRAIERWTVSDSARTEITARLLEENRRRALLE